jgi:autotransporter-associated beta strand protein
MADTTWQSQPGSNDYNDANNWSFGAPTADGIAYFGSSQQTALAMNTLLMPGFAEAVGSWVFNPSAPSYSFTITGGTFAFVGAGIVANNGNAPTIVGSGNLHLEFLNNSTAGASHISGAFSLLFENDSNAGTAAIVNGRAMSFLDDSSAGSATITNLGFDLDFRWRSTAANALIHTAAGATTTFNDFSTGGAAAFVTDLGGSVSFDASAGQNGDHRISAGSIAGAGNYFLGADQLSVGSNGLSTTVSGAVDDGGDLGIPDAVGASLVKVGPASLALSHANNTYSGGTTLAAGTFDVAALGAAGTGAISFAGRATLRIENAALDGRAFDNPIIAFGKHDVIDLAGLHFHAGATARYHPATHHLTVHSGGTTDVLTLLSPHGTHFRAVTDHHGGTDILLHA